MMAGDGINGSAGVRSTAVFEVVKGGVKQEPEPLDLTTVDDPDKLRQIAQKRGIAFHPAATVARMRRRLLMED